MTERLTGEGEKAYVLQETAPSTSPLRDQNPGYEKDGSWQHDSTNWHKNLALRASSGIRWPLPEVWSRYIERPFNDLIVKPLRRLLGIQSTDQD